MLTRISRLFYGWRMIAVGSALRVLGGGLYYYGFSVFFLPLSQDLGLNRAATSLVFSLARAQGAFEAPIAGYFIDRYGPRPLMITALIMTGIGHMVLSGVHTYAMLLIVYMGVVSLSFHAGFMDAPMVIANTWFIRRRTIAMAIISGSIGLGGFLLTPLLSQAIQAWGWRRAAFANGIAFLLIGLPLALFVRRSPESMGLRPDGQADVSSETANTRGKIEVEEKYTTLAAAMRTSAFWLLTLATALRIVALSAVNVHYVPIMVWKGMSAQRAAFFLGAQAFLGLISHVLVGWIADRFDKARLMAICMGISAIGLLFLIYADSEWKIWIFLPLFTVVESTFPVNWSAVGEFFGRKHFAKIRGTMSFVQTWGAVIGPVIAGAIYDSTHSYIHLLWGLVGLLLVTGVLYALVVNPSLRSQRVHASS
ncbi:MAG TPA: MFS transporter [Verrucomicrobiae bacterium]|jgi:MFS family permease|nr:MFS transporter [Verrucomicrobiae bacterium]